MNAFDPGMYKLRMGLNLGTMFMMDLRECSHENSEFAATQTKSNNYGASILVTDRTWPVVRHVLECFTLFDEPEQDEYYKSLARSAKLALKRCADHGFKTEDKS